MIEETVRTYAMVSNLLAKYKQIADNMPMHFEFYNTNTGKYYYHSVVLENGTYFADSFKEATAISEPRCIPAKEFEIDGMLHADELSDTMDALRHTQEVLNATLKNHDGNPEQPVQ